MGITFFAKTLNEWYLRHRRDLPWRVSTDPYRIWLSEIMLQQTRVVQATPYFFAFTDAFPTVFDLAHADEEQVLKLWQGLGYYSRARNLHATAKSIADRDGKFPETFAELRKLKGIGDYTAAAIASIAFDEAVPVVDGNVFRVLARYFGVDADIAKPSARKIFFDLALTQIPSENPGLFNQAMMEFGSLQCIPKNPDCIGCVLNSTCVAYATGAVNRLPVKSAKAPSTKKYLNYLVVKDSLGNTIINRRTKGIWRHLYEFPVVETVGQSIISQEELPTEWGPPVVFEPMPEYDVIHKLTHRELHIRFIEVSVDIKLENGVSADKIEEYPFPVVLANFIKRHFKT
jgi:A/G-specific adenine glycosylase